MIGVDSNTNCFSLCSDGVVKENNYCINCGKESSVGQFVYCELSEKGSRNNFPIPSLCSITADLQNQTWLTPLHSSEVQKVMDYKKKREKLDDFTF